jgi:nucleotide-binding universal stress UspA family protein
MTTEENKTNVILVPTDFSEICENAVNYALELAKHFKWDVCILHVLNKDTKNYLKKENLSEEQLEARLKEIEGEHSSKFGVNVSFVLKRGNLFEKIGETSKEADASLIILGTHGKVGFQRLTGSYALKVISSTNVPTIVVQKRSFSGFNNVVFPVTVSTQDRQKVNWAIAIAKAFDATIHIFPKFESEKYLKKNIMSVTKQIKTIFDKHDVKHIDKVSEEHGGNFAKQVLDYTVVNNCDLIIIMTSSDQALPMLDSWDEQMMFNSSQIPTICINTINVKKARFGWY